MPPIAASSVIVQRLVGVSFGVPRPFISPSFVQRLRMCFLRYRTTAPHLVEYSQCSRHRTSDQVFGSGATLLPALSPTRSSSSLPAFPGAALVEMMFTARNRKPFSFRKRGPTGTRRFDSTKPTQLRFCALLRESDSRVNFYREGFGRFKGDLA